MSWLLLVALKDLKEGGLAEWKENKGLCMLYCGFMAIFRRLSLVIMLGSSLLLYCTISHSTLHRSTVTFQIPSLLATPILFLFLYQPSLSPRLEKADERCGKQIYAYYYHIVLVVYLACNVFSCTSGDGKASKQTNKN